MVGVRVRASIVGQVVSMSLAMGSVTCLRTKALYHVTKYHVVNYRNFGLVSCHTLLMLARSSVSGNHPCKLSMGGLFGFFLGLYVLSSQMLALRAIVAVV